MTEPTIKTIFSCVLCFILNPINFAEFDLWRTYGKSALATPSTCLMARVLVVLSSTFWSVLYGKLVELVCGLWSLKVKLCLGRFIPSGCRIWTHSIETQETGKRADRRRLRKEKTDRRDLCPDTMRPLVAIWSRSCCVNTTRIAIINPQGTLVSLVLCLQHYRTRACLLVASVL